MTTASRRRSTLLAGLGVAYAVLLGHVLRPSERGEQFDPMAPAVRAVERALHDGRGDEALALARALVTQRPDEPFIRYLAATVLHEQARWAEAAAAWEAYIARVPLPLGACPHVAEAYRRAGDASRAVAHYRACQALDPQNPARLADLARALVDVGQVDEARSIYDRAIALDPTEPGVTAERAALEPR